VLELTISDQRQLWRKENNKGTFKPPNPQRGDEGAKKNKQNINLKSKLSSLPFGEGWGGAYGSFKNSNSRKCR
jgi:hypothetical protein